MTRTNTLRSMKEMNSIAWGKQLLSKNAGALIFAAVLIVCSVTVGCSSEKPKPVSSNNQVPITQPPIPVQPAPAMQAENKPAPKKVVRKKPATVNYTDKTYGVTFEYPRRYAIETGTAANELIQASTVPMNFVQPGGTALAAVELPETSFANTDFSFAFFNVSVNKNLTPDQCNEFAVPQPKMSVATSTPEAKPETTIQAPSTETAKVASSDSTASGQPSTPSEAKPVIASSDSSSVQTDSGSKLLLGDLELRATEAVSGEGTRQSDSKYFHAYQNGACYEFALNVTTVASSDGLIKHVNRDKVFDRLEKILATVKINSVSAPEVAADAPAQPPTSVTPAQ
jgi:hypothetical protein